MRIVASIFTNFINLIVRPFFVVISIVLINRPIVFLYYSNMIIASLSQFRAETMGYPGYMENIDEWYAILDKIIFLLKQANEDEPLEEKNNLAEWYDGYLATKNLDMTEVANGKAMRISLTEVDEETETKRKQYYKREEELYEIRKQKRKEAFELLAEYFGHLWW